MPNCRLCHDCSMSRVEELRANLKRAKAMEELGIDVTKQIKALQDKKTFTR